MIFGSPHQLNNVVKVGPTLKKRSGSAHVVPVKVEEFVDTGPGKVVVIVVEGCCVVGGVVGRVVFGVFVVTVFTVVGVAVVIGRPVVGGAVVEGCWVVTGGFAVVGACVTAAVVLAVVGCAPPGVVTDKTRNVFKKDIRRSNRRHNVRNFKEIEKKKWGIFIICYVIGQLSSIKRLALGTYAIPKYL